MPTIHDHRALDDQESHTGPEELTIGDLSHLTGVSVKAIRYYESIGLLPPASRGPNGYRHYITADVNRVNLLHRLRFLGASLTDAKPLLEATTTAQCSQIQAKLLHLVQDRLAILDQEITELTNLRKQVEACQQQLATCPLQKPNHLLPVLMARVWPVLNSGRPLNRKAGRPVKSRDFILRSHRKGRDK